MARHGTAWLGRARPGTAGAARRGQAWPGMARHGRARQEMNPYRDIDFVITGAPRSGTGYVAAVLKTLGIDCGHEAYINPWQFVTGRNDTSEPWGDSSWMAVPFLRCLPRYTKVIHIVRDPLKCIRSIIGTGQLREDNVYRRFIARRTWGEEDAWPVDQEKEAQRFWIEWNHRIEDSGRVTRRYQIEDLPGRIFDLTEMIGVFFTGDAVTAAAKKAEKVPTDINTRERFYPTKLTEQTLTREVRYMAEKYSYSSYTKL